MIDRGTYEVGCSGGELERAELMPHDSGEKALAALRRDGDIVKGTKMPRLRSNRSAQARRLRKGRRTQWFYRLTMTAAMRQAVG